MGKGGGERGEHEVADAEKGEMSDGSGSEGWAKDEEEDLDYVMEALEVREARVAAEDLGDYI